MARVYSARLAAGVVAAGDTVVYTVPPNQKAVLLDVENLNISASPAGLKMGLLPLGGSLVPIVNFFVSVPEEGGPWRGRLVLNAGDSLVLTAEDSYSYAMSGYLFLV